jgi:DNA repair exonuclease SbcCD nuclease subunit
MKFLLTADLHLTERVPRCRLDDDWMQTQIDHLDQIAKYANKYKVPVAIPGDIFDRAVVTDKVKSMFLQFVTKVKAGVYAIAGNHDLPYHSWDNADSSSFGVVWNSGVLHHLNELGSSAHFGEELSGVDNGLLFIHVLVFPSIKEAPPMDGDIVIAQDLLNAFPGAQWIFTGDYHHSFVYEKNGRRVVNPGCINRQKADVIDYIPSVMLIDTDAESIKQLEIKDDVAMVTDEYLKKEEERETRISAFVESVRSSEEVSLDFLSNLRGALKANRKMEGEVKQTIIELIEECDNDN